MLTALVIVGVILGTLGTLIKRLLDMNALKVWLWPLFLVAAALPIATAWLVLNPGEPVATAQVKAAKDVVRMEVPEGYALMVTAQLTEEMAEGEEGRTAYSLALRREGWTSAASGTIHRASDKDAGPDLSSGESVSEAGKRPRMGRWGEDVQDRHDLDGAGTLEITVTNWQGKAAEHLLLEAVSAPPPRMVLWIGAIVVALVGLAAELRLGTDRLAGDVAFLALWAVFLRDGCTPFDDFDQVARAAIPAALLGWGAVGGISYLAQRYGIGVEPGTRTAPNSGGAADPAAPRIADLDAPVVPVAPPEGSQTRRRRDVARKEG